MVSQPAYFSVFNNKNHTCIGNSSWILLFNFLCLLEVRKFLIQRVCNCICSNVFAHIMLVNLIMTLYGHLLSAGNDF